MNTEPASPFSPVPVSLPADSASGTSRRSAFRSPHFILALLLIGGTAGLLLAVHPKLGKAGVRTSPIKGNDICVKVELPPKVLDYDSQERDQDPFTLSVLPTDTSFGERIYSHSDRREDDLKFTVVLMGMDRTSLHKPQICLSAAGLQIDQAKTLETSVRIERPFAYDLPVTRIIASKDGTQALYVYWFVADGQISSGQVGGQRLWRLASGLLRTGVLDRWAYVSCLGFCAPGQEDATFERMKKFIAAAVPEFQMPPRAPELVLNSKP
ncbi:MAG: hypothetical protein C5B50_16965 [Verrucomicrobia bacterium]|nr:MAG: hypothetical protein C5B50_16965 [Verrucomicrobiota bacterium]